MKKILLVAGARPNFVKIAALTSQAPQFSKKLQMELIHTGQHYDDELSQIFFNEFNMPRPIANLGIGSGKSVEQIKRVMQGISPYLEKLKPDLLVVVGDVLSTVGASYAGLMANVPIAHIEAGLRSFNWQMPEEINRVSVDHRSDLLFATENSAMRNLENEKIDMTRVHLVGNVMIDTLLRFKEQAEHSVVLSKLGVSAREYALFTLHRQENTDNLEVLKNILGAVNEAGATTQIIFPLHPRTKKIIEENKLEGVISNIKIIEPQGYFDFLALEINSKFIITDSGGIQEEASVLEKPCITVRTETERPATCEFGTNEIAGTEKQKILELINRANSGNWKKGGQIPLWDGKAGERILNTICGHFNI